MKTSKLPFIERECLIEKYYLLAVPFVAIGISIYFVFAMGRTDGFDGNSAAEPVLALSPGMVIYTLILWVALPAFLCVQLFKKRSSGRPERQAPVKTVYAKRMVETKASQPDAKSSHLDRSRQGSVR